MATCALLLVTLVLSAAQDLPVSFTSTEGNKIDDSKNYIKIPDLFEDDELIIYTTSVPNSEDDPSGNNIRDNVWFEEDEEVVVYTPTQPTSRDDPSGIRDNVWFEEDEEVVVYTPTQPTSREQNNELGSKSSFGSITGTSRLNSDFEFDNLDSVNEDESTLFDEFNQTIIREMIAGRLKPTPRPIKHTTEEPPIIELDISIYGTPEPPLINLDNSLFVIDAGNQEPTATVASDNGEIITTESDYDYDQYKNDPCNYERIPHSIPSVPRNGRRVSELKCEELMWEYKLDVTNVEKKRLECIENSKKSNAKYTEIVGGFRAKQGDFPHMGAVGWIRKDDGVKWMCGSSLISPWFTLTAGHCRKAGTAAIKRFNLLSAEPKLVRFGSVFLERKDDLTQNLTADHIVIDEFLVHPEFAKDPKKKYNDLGLIKLKEMVQFHLYIKPACLWNGFVGNDWSANITGWGKTSNADGSESSYLKYAMIDFVPKDLCKQYVRGRESRQWPEGLKDHQFCAGKLQGGIDSCQGDSGGPLGIRQAMILGDHTDILHRVVGVTNFGIACAYPFLPGVYTNVTDFLCWIEKTVWESEPNEFCP